MRSLLNAIALDDPVYLKNPVFSGKIPKRSQFWAITPHQAVQFCRSHITLLA
ncbi:MAG: hypothetical protein ABI180_09870 [Microcoleus sp.]